MNVRQEFAAQMKLSWVDVCRREQMLKISPRCPHSEKKAAALVHLGHPWRAETLMLASVGTESGSPGAI